MVLGWIYQRTKLNILKLEIFSAHTRRPKWKMWFNCHSNNSRQHQLCQRKMLNRRNDYNDYIAERISFSSIFIRLFFIFFFDSIVTLSMSEIPVDMWSSFFPFIMIFLCVFSLWLWAFRSCFCCCHVYCVLSSVKIKGSIRWCWKALVLCKWRVCMCVYCL